MSPKECLYFENLQVKQSPILRHIIHSRIRKATFKKIKLKFVLLLFLLFCLQLFPRFVQHKVENCPFSGPGSVSSMIKGEGDINWISGGKVKINIPLQAKVKYSSVLYSSV